MRNAMTTLILASTALLVATGGSIAQTSVPPSTTQNGGSEPGTVSTRPPTTASLPAEAASRGVVGITVKGPDDKTVGKIDNVIMSPDNRVSALVIDVGGVLGVGGKDVLVDPQDIQINDRADVASTSLSEDQLKAKREYHAPARSNQ